MPAGNANTASGQGVVASPDTSAQDLLSHLPAGMTPQQVLQQIQSGAQPGPAQTATEAEPLAHPPAHKQSAGLSAMERIFSERAGLPLRQFGYDLVGNGGTIPSLQIGAIQDDYILGEGDEIVITLKGQENATYRSRVDRDGRLVLLNLQPLSASGRRFGDLRRELEAAIQRSYVKTQVFISVAQIRQLSINIVGEVDSPGVYQATGLSTVLDVLNMAGGIRKTGSLRNITVVRGNRSFRIDLYSMLLTHGRTPNMTVAQGDRIVVPPIGSTVAISGDIRRAGIFELPQHASAIRVRDLAALGNGPQLRGVYREMVLRIRPDGKEELVDANANPNALVRDGEILFVNHAVSASLGQVTLVGAVRLPGNYALNKTKTLHDLLPSVEALAPTPYMLLGVVEHTDAATLRRSLVPFSPLHVLQGKENMNLSSGDRVHILTIAEMRRLAKSKTGLTDEGGADGDGSATAVQDDPTAGSPPAATNSSSSSSGVIGTSAETGELSGNGLTPEDTEFFGRVLADYAITLNGAVRNPGVFLVAPETSLDEVVFAAGGLNTDVDLNKFEITSTTIDNASGQSTTTRKYYKGTDFQAIVLKPKDQIQFYHAYSDVDGGTVVLSGELIHPGTYSVLRGEHLSSIIERAGGYSQASYPYGAVLTRPSEAAHEKIAFIAQADELDSQLGARVISGKVTAESAAYLGTLSHRLRVAVPTGRITIVADLDILKRRPELDIVLHSGDKIVIPGRPGSILVTGEVRNPGAVLFRPEWDVNDYVDAVGGLTRLADDGGMFVVYPDGTAHPVGHSFWFVGGNDLAPGSMIVVPRDVTPPVDWLDLTEVITKITSELALTAASITVIGK